MANEVRLIDANRITYQVAYLPTTQGAEKVWAATERDIENVLTIDPERLRPAGRIVLKERHRGGFQIVTGVDEFGNEHTVRIDTRTVGKEPYCSNCGAALADSFQDYCPRCGAKMEG